MPDETERYATRAKLRELRESINKEIGNAQAEHPTKARLAKGMMNRILTVFEAGLVDENPDWLAVLDQCGTEIQEISSWLFSQPKFTEADITVFVRSWIEAGMNPVQAVKAVEESTKRHRGHPVTRRSTAVQALDLKLANPRLSWAKVADRLCNCGLRERHKHNSPCCQVLRQEVRLLNKFLEELNL